MHEDPEQPPSAPQNSPKAATKMLAPPTTWSAEELAGLDAATEFGSGPALAYDAESSKFNPTPGTACAACTSVAVRSAARGAGLHAARASVGPMLGLSACTPCL